MKPIAIALSICLLGMNGAPGFGAPVQGSVTRKADWTRVSRIRSNEKISVRLLNGTTLRGKFVRADADSLTLLTKGKDNSRINRDEIQRIRRKSSAVGALIGLSVGMAGGAGVGAAARGSSDMSRAATAGIGSVLFGLGGALAGGLIGIERTLYENPSPGAQMRPENK